MQSAQAPGKRVSNFSIHLSRLKLTVRVYRSNKAAAPTKGFDGNRSKEAERQSRFSTTRDPGPLHTEERKEKSEGRNPQSSVGEHVPVLVPVPKPLDVLPKRFPLVFPVFPPPNAEVVEPKPRRRSGIACQRTDTSTPSLHPFVAVSLSVESAGDSIGTSKVGGEVVGFARVIAVAGRPTGAPSQ